MERLLVAQELGGGDGEVADAAAGRVVDGVADGCGGAGDADLADALGAHRVQVRVVFLDPRRVQVLHVGVGGDVVLREVPAGEAAVCRVYVGTLHQRHAQAHRHRPGELGAGQRRVDNPAGGEH